MKKLLLAGLVVLACLGYTGCSSGIFDSCHPGDMRCHGNVAQMCDAYNNWEAYQDCGSIGERCGTSAQACSGYAGLACCY